MPVYPIWGALAPEQAHEIFLSAQETQKKLYKTGLETLSKYMGQRPNRVVEMPKTERHAAWQRLLGHPQLEPLGFNFLCHWLIEKQGPLLIAWLDAIGVPHDGKGVVEDFPPAPSKEKLNAALDQVLKTYDAKLVSIYLRTFNEIDGVAWADLDAIIDSDPRLKLEAPAAA